MAGTRPHFPAVNTCPPSTAMASASSRCTMSGKTIHQAQRRLLFIISSFFTTSPPPPNLPVSFLHCITMIIFRHSSTVGANWHRMALVSPTMLLMLHVSHLEVSASPTAHHLTDLPAADCSSAAEEGGAPWRLIVKTSYTCWVLFLYNVVRRYLAWENGWCSCTRRPSTGRSPSVKAAAPTSPWSPWTSGFCLHHSPPRRRVQMAGKSRKKESWVMSKKSMEHTWFCRTRDIFFLLGLSWGFWRSCLPALAPGGWQLRVQVLWQDGSFHRHWLAPLCCLCTAAHSWVFPPLKMITHIWMADQGKGPKCPWCEETVATSAALCCHISRWSIVKSFTVTETKVFQLETWRKKTALCFKVTEELTSVEVP